MKQDKSKKTDANSSSNKNTEQTSEDFYRSRMFELFEENSKLLLRLAEYDLQYAQENLKKSEFVIKISERERRSHVLPQNPNLSKFIIDPSKINPCVKCSKACFFKKSLQNVRKYACPWYLYLKLDDPTESLIFNVEKASDIAEPQIHNLN